MNMHDLDMQPELYMGSLPVFNASESMYDKYSKMNADQYDGLIVVFMLNQEGPLASLLIHP